MSRKRKRNIIIGCLCAVVLLMAVGYAAFQSSLNIQGTSNITSSWNIKITNITSKDIVGSAGNNEEPTFENLKATFNSDLVMPGDSISYEVTITNAGTLNAKLDKITLSDTNNPAIKFTTSGLTEGDVLKAGSIAALTVKVEYLSNVTKLPTNLISELTVTLDYSQATGGSISGGSNAADMLKEKVVTTGDGLYEDTTEPGRYIYRGASPLNNITFNNEAYRVISVEADNTIKIIKEEKLETDMAVDTANSRTSAYCADTKYGCNVWGSKTTMLDASGQNITQLSYDLNSPTKYELPASEATLNTYLNGEYYNGLSAEAKGQITSHTFNTGVLLSASGQTLETDVSQVKANKWNGNIGLIEATDYAKASTDSGCTDVYNGSHLSGNYPCKNGNYLYKSGYHWWTISPYSYTHSLSVWSVRSFGDFGNYVASYTYSIRPVMFLKSDITLSGEGTAANPYRIDG